MAITYPTSLDAFSNPTAADATNNLTTPHATQHANENDAIEALESKVGTGASTPTANTLLRGTGTGTSAFGAAAITDITGGVVATAYTPVLSGSGTAGTFTYSVQVGRYSRIGNIVVAHFNVRVTAASVAPTGDMRITLPATTANITNYAAICALMPDPANFSAGYTSMVGLATANTAQIRLVQIGDNVASLDFPSGSMAYAFAILGTITYLDG